MHHRLFWEPRYSRNDFSPTDQKNQGDHSVTSSAAPPCSRALQWWKPVSHRLISPTLNTAILLCIVILLWESCTNSSMMHSTSQYFICTTEKLQLPHILSIVFNDKEPMIIDQQTTEEHFSSFFIFIFLPLSASSIKGRPFSVPPLSSLHHPCLPPLSISVSSPHLAFLSIHHNKHKINSVKMGEKKQQRTKDNDRRKYQLPPHPQFSSSLHPASPPYSHRKLKKKNRQRRKDGQRMDRR